MTRRTNTRAAPIRIGAADRTGPNQATPDRAESVPIEPVSFEHDRSGGRVEAVPGTDPSRDAAATSGLERGSLWRSGAVMVIGCALAAAVVAGLIGLLPLVGLSVASRVGLFALVGAIGGGAYGLALAPVGARRRHPARPGRSS